MGRFEGSCGVIAPLCDFGVFSLGFVVKGVEISLGRITR